MPARVASEPAWGRLFRVRRLWPAKSRKENRKNFAAPEKKFALRRSTRAVPLMVFYCIAACTAETDIIAMHAVRSASGARGVIKLIRDYGLAPPAIDRGGAHG